MAALWNEDFDMIPCGQTASSGRAISRFRGCARGARSAEAATEIFVEKVSDFAEGDRRTVRHDGLEIGVFHRQGTFYAYENLCLLRAAPVVKTEHYRGKAVRLFNLNLGAEKLAQEA